MTEQAQTEARGLIPASQTSIGEKFSAWRTAQAELDDVNGRVEAARDCLGRCALPAGLLQERAATQARTWALEDVLIEEGLRQQAAKRAQEQSQIETT